MRINRCPMLLLALPGLAISVLASSAFAQITFERSYGTPFRDYALSVQQTSDGGYILAGSGGLTVLRTDSLGDSLWARKLGPDGWVVRGESVQQTLDGGYIVAGSIHPVSEQHDIYLVKLDSLGDTLWSRTYGGEENDGGYSVQQTSDSGYILVGDAKSFGDTLADVFLIKTDPHGDTLWTRTYGDTLPDAGYSVEQTSDGGYIIAGMANYTYAPFTCDVYLVKTDAQGDTLWSRIHGHTGFADHGHSVQQTSDGGYIIAGTAFFSASVGGMDRMYLIKTDSQGDTLWTRTYLDRDRSCGYSVTQTYDGGYNVAGESFLSDGAGRLAYIVRTDSKGDTLWTRTYGHPWISNAFSVRQTSDSGFVVAGMIKPSMKLREFYLVKMNDFGETEPERDMAVVSIDAPADTVFPDTLCEVTATVHSYSNVIDSLYVSASIDGYADTVKGLWLQPGSSLQVHFANWFVPSSDSTTYTMTVCARVPDDIDTTNDCMQKEIFAYNPTGVEERLDRRGKFGFHLCQNEPNPFHRSTVIQYSLPTQCEVTLSVYDVTGSLVGELVDEQQGPGFYRAHWDLQGCADGIYFCRLMAGNLTGTKKMVLVR